MSDIWPAVGQEPLPGLAGVSLEPPGHDAQIIQIILAITKKTKNKQKRSYFTLLVEWFCLIWREKRHTHKLNFTKNIFFNSIKEEGRKGQIITTVQGEADFQTPWVTVSKSSRFPHWFYTFLFCTIQTERVRGGEKIGENNIINRVVLL